MALVVLGLFVLVWIISAVVKASQDTGPKRRPEGRPRPLDDGPRPERTSNSDIDRFMAEIDRLRRKGEGCRPAGRGRRPRPGPAADHRAARPASSRARSRPSPGASGTASVATRRSPRRRPRRRCRGPSRCPSSGRSRPTRPATTASAPIKPAQTAKTTATTTVSSSTRASPIVETLQAVLRGKQGPRGRPDPGRGSSAAPRGRPAGQAEDAAYPLEVVPQSPPPPKALSHSASSAALGWTSFSGGSSGASPARDLRALNNWSTYSPHLRTPAPRRVAASRTRPSFETTVRSPATARPGAGPRSYRPPSGRGRAAPADRGGPARPLRRASSGRRR